jgi:hypothetical protein
MNHSNKSGRPPAESEEGRPLVKENTHQSSTPSTQSEIRVSQGLAGVRKAAKERKGMQFTCAPQKLHPRLTPRFPRANIHGGVRRERQLVQPYVRAVIRCR